MIEIFGTPLGLSEVIMVVGLFATVLASYYRLDHRLQQIIERNTARDKEHELLEGEVAKLGTAFNTELITLKNNMDSKLSVTEDRLRTQDVFMGRLDERFNSMSVQLDRLIELVQKGNK